MDVESLIDNVLKLSSIKNGSFNYCIPIKSDIKKFTEEYFESSPLLFEYILYKIIKSKFFKNGAPINSDLIILSEDYLNINIKNRQSINTSADLFLVPFKDNSINKWGLLLLPNKNTKNTTAKIIMCKKRTSNRPESIFYNIASKIYNNYKKDEKCKFDILDISGVSNTSKFILNFINELLEKDRDKLNIFLKKVFNKNDNKDNNNKSNESKEIKKVAKSMDIIGKLSDNNLLFKNLINNYNNEYNDYLKSKNKIISKKDIKNKEKKNDDSTSKKVEDVQNNFETNLNIEKEKQKNLIFNEKEKIKNKLKNEKRNEDNLEELAQRVVKSIMNLGVDKLKKSKTFKNTHKEKKLDKITQKIEESFDKLKFENESIKKTKTFNILDIKEDEDIFNIENDVKKENLNNTMDDIFDLNINQINYDNICDNKKIDEVTKNTIDDILNSVLNDMKINNNNNKYSSKKYIKKKNKINSKYRLRTINIDQKIDTIEEEDKESSTSEVNKNDKFNLNYEEDKKMNSKENNKLKDSIKMNNSFEIEPRPSAYSFNRENSDENSKFREGEIEFEEKEVRIGKVIEIDEPKKEKIVLQNLNIDNIKDNFNKKNSDDIEHKEESENKENSHKSDSNSNDINDNSINNTISNNNSVIDNNTNDIDNNNNFYEIDSLDTFININRSNTTKEKEKNIIKNIIRNSSPKDNNRKKKINFNSNTFNIQPKIILKNIINNNTTNNININTINAQNIIIINNTVPNSNNNNNKINTSINDSNIEKEKKEEIKIKKEPEDEKVPKDNKTKRKSQNTNKNLEIVSNKEPSDGKKLSSQYIKLSHLSNDKIMVKDELNDSESKYSSKTIEVEKCNNNINENKIDFLRSNSGLDNFRKNLDDNININNKINIHGSSSNINNIRHKYIQLGKQTEQDYKMVFQIGKEMIPPHNILNNNSSSSRELNQRKKMNINKTVINNLENKYPNILNKKKKINTNISIKSKKMNYEEFDKISKTNQLNHKRSQNLNINEQQFSESRDAIDENCILF